MRAVSNEVMKVLQKTPMGRWSFRLMCAFALLALFTPLIANEMPLMVHYEGRLYFPMVAECPETCFGGKLPLRTDFHDPQVQKDIAEKDGWILWPLIPYSSGTRDHDVVHVAPTPPSLEHWAGVDDQGRDVLARILYAMRFSLAFGLSFALICVMIGGTLGAIQGYKGGKTDLFSQRIVEIWSSIPVLFLMIALSSFISMGFWSLLLTLSLFKWVALVPVMRVVLLRTRTAQYVKAARMMGRGTWAILWQHILPNIIFFPLSRLPFLLISGIAVLTTLDFFGIVLPDEVVTFGEILLQGKNNLYAPWIVLWGSFSFMAFLVPLVFLGESLQKAFIYNQSRV